MTRKIKKEIIESMLGNFKLKHEMLRHGLEDNIKMYFWCIVCEVMGLIGLTTDKLSIVGLLWTRRRIFECCKYGRYILYRPNGYKRLPEYTFVELYGKQPASAVSCFERAFVMSFVELLVDALNAQFNAFDCWE